MNAGPVTIAYFAPCGQSVSTGFDSLTFNHTRSSSVPALQRQDTRVRNGIALQGHRRPNAIITRYHHAGSVQSGLTTQCWWGCSPLNRLLTAEERDVKLQTTCTMTVFSPFKVPT